MIRLSVRPDHSPQLDGAFSYPITRYPAVAAGFASMDNRRSRTSGAIAGAASLFASAAAGCVMSLPVVRTVTRTSRCPESQGQTADSIVAETGPFGAGASS